MRDLPAADFTSDTDRTWMLRALAEAGRGRGAVEPNPMVGAVVVRDGHAVGIGHHRVFGGPHAEVEALARAGDLAVGSTLYVTLEPCCHHGKTPPCSDAVIAHGVARVVAAMRDPFPRVAGGGLRQLRAAGIAVTVGVARAEAFQLNAPYLKRLHTGRPYVTAKWAMTLDGRTAVASGDSRWISGPRSRAMVHEVRGRMDAIVAGIGTVLADDPELTARPPGSRVPVRLVLDSEARLPLQSRLVQTTRVVPVWVAITDRAPAERARALADAGCVVLPLPGSGPVPVGPLLDELGRRGLTNVLIEGGGRTLGSFLDAAEVDAIDVYIAPKIEGGSHAFGPARGQGVGTMSEALGVVRATWSEVDGDLRLQGQLRRSWWAASDLDDPQDEGISLVTGEPPGSSA